VVKTLKTVDDDEDDNIEPIDGTVPTVEVEQGTISVIVVTKAEPCAFVVVYRLVVVV